MGAKILEIICNFVYYNDMGRKCRILSIFVIAVFVACSAVCVTLAVSKNIKRREIYATSITFNSPRSMDLYIDNSLIISNDIVTICPNNCTVKPTFYLSTRDDLDVREEMDGQTFKFNATGSYVITCEIASSKYGYTKSDYITINVIDAPVKDETPMYIRRSENVISPIQGDDIELNNMLDIICPNNANVEILVNDKLKLIDGCIQTVNSGMGEVICI